MEPSSRKTIKTHPWFSNNDEIRVFSHVTSLTSGSSKTLNLFYWFKLTRLVCTGSITVMAGVATTGSITAGYRSTIVECMANNGFPLLIIPSLLFPL
jgi:hypothetical protein